MKKATPTGERGFALLVVFLMAAAIALMLYQQMPRVGFESQRDKEDTLIARGEQFKRGIQLYFLEFKKYPAKIEDLENTNNKRFLRRRYIDPMTGKNEWRLIHVNGAGQLTDSLVEKPPKPTDDKTQLASNGTTTAGATGATGATGTNTNPGAPDAQPEVNAAVLRRPSDRSLVPSGPIAGVGGFNPAIDPNDPRTWPPIALQPAGQTGATGAQPGLNPPGFIPQFPGQQYPGQTLPGQTLPGQPDPTQQPFQGQPGGIQPGMPGFPGNNPQGVVPNPGIIPPQNPPGQDPNQPTGIQPVPITQQGFNPNGNAQGNVPNPALTMINTMLTTPRQAPTAPTTNNNPLNAGGLAGVATTYSGPSIKTYRERSKYNEWEFIYDLKQGVPGQPAAKPSNAPNSPLNNPLGPTK